MKNRRYGTFNLDAILTALETANKKLFGTDRRPFVTRTAESVADSKDQRAQLDSLHDDLVMRHNRCQYTALHNGSFSVYCSQPSHSRNKKLLIIVVKVLRLPQSLPEATER